MKHVALSAVALLAVISMSAFAVNETIDQKKNREKPVSPIKAVAFEEEVEEFDPTAPGALETLKAFDQVYRMEMGEDTMSEALWYPEALQSLTGGCERAACHLWVNVVKAEQKLYLYVDGREAGSWLVSTAGHGRVTPNFDGHPSGPFYPGKYSSKTYPGGDYKGLGNMPYAMFYNTKGYALHGTPSINKLGRPDSHGCTRMHPDNAKYLNQMVRATGAAGFYVTVSERRVNPAVPMMLSER